MSKYISIIIVLISSVLHAQDYNKDFSTLVESETKAAVKRLGGTRNVNTSNYDLKYHRLEFTVDPSESNINGIITSYFVANEDMDEITFELSSNMTVSLATSNGASLDFIQNADDEVVITFNNTVTAGSLDSITVAYNGNPQSSGFGSYEVSVHEDAPIVWTLSEPYGAKGWWPCKQDLNDKIDSIDTYITTPLYNPSGEEYVAVSNGLELSQVIVGTNKTTRYKHRHPIPAYLIAMAVTNYEVYNEVVPNDGNPFNITNYVYPEHVDFASSSTAITVDIMALYKDLFEEYPYSDEKYGHAEFGWGGGMEHTTVSFMGGFSRGLIAHELAHQWFGDKITCGSWQDIWLNEGFATYLAALVIEDFDGATAFANWRESRIDFITSEPAGSVYIPAADTSSVGRIFSGRLSYNKPAMVLHMLRKKLGDDAFFQGVQSYLSQEPLAFDYARTPDFIAAMESSAGVELSEFFDDWIYNEGYPTYTVDWYPLDNEQISITISQEQSHPSVDFFEVPVPLRLVSASGDVLDVVLDNTVDAQNFILSTPFVVDEVQLDPDFDIISKNNSVVLGISNLQELESKIEITPNPADNYIHIISPSEIVVKDVRVYDSSGKEVTHTSTSTVEIDLLARGMYTLIIITDRGSLTKKFTKN